jgi:hypothetical protein
MKLEPNGFIGYGKADGFALKGTMGILETTEGSVCVIGWQWRLQCFEGQHFTGVQLNSPAASNLSPSSGTYKYPGRQDHTGEWWIATGQGVFRFAPVDRITRLATAHPKRVYTTRDGLASNVIDALFEDSRGDVWMCMTHGVANWLAWWPDGSAPPSSIYTLVRMGFQHMRALAALPKTRMAMCGWGYGRVAWFASHAAGSIR